MARVVSVHSFRGGTGKSNLTANLAVLLAHRSLRVGVVDTDIQSPGIHVLFGLAGGFYFTGSDRVAGNLREFHRHLAACGDNSLTTHARHHDFSRWINQVLQDAELAGTVEAIERRLRAGQIPIEGLRDAIQLAIEIRYLD